jgi:ATP-dependent Clp protease adaptor protein ClpS
MKNVWISSSWQTQEFLDQAVLEDVLHSLIVWNDDVNTFDWVAKSLVEICGHSPEQAEQCAIIIHQKGKYAVKKGSYEQLRPQCNALLDRGIQASIGEQ